MKRKDVDEMKMTKRAINVTVFAAVAIMFLLAFGYCFKMFHEINAMDLSSLNGCAMGVAATDITEEPGDAADSEIAEVKNVETVITNCMKDENVISSVRADYANHRIVYLMLADGTAAAAKSGDADEWNKVRELGDSVSLEGMEILEDNGLDGWSFDVEILNDVHPVNALLTFADGECTYDCMAE
jgi:hypothetical protein